MILILPECIKWKFYFSIHYYFERNCQMTDCIYKSKKEEKKKEKEKRARVNECKSLFETNSFLARTQRFSFLFLFFFSLEHVFWFETEFHWKSMSCQYPVNELPFSKNWGNFVSCLLKVLPTPQPHPPPFETKWYALKVTQWTLLNYGPPIKRALFNLEHLYSKIAK